MGGVEVWVDDDGGRDGIGFAAATGLLLNPVSSIQDRVDLGTREGDKELRQKELHGAVKRRGNYGNG